VRRFRTGTAGLTCLKVPPRGPRTLARMETTAPVGDRPDPPAAAGRPAPGLASAEAAARLRRDGPNRLPQPDRRRWPQVVAAVLREPMILMLVAASVVYLLLGDATEAGILAASVVLVAALTVFQELRSERALQALRDLSSPRARVLRDGQAQVIAGGDVVVGDVMLLAEGDRVPADARLLEAQGLVLDESLLTGESVPVQRTAAVAASEEEGRVHASTLVVAGHGTALVTATGSRTAVGRIGQALGAIAPERTPLQAEMRHVVALFATLGVISCLAVVALYLRSTGDWLHALLAGITLAVANIPEEFPVVLAVFLALGAWRMARHKALVRRAPAIEALGAVTVLCVDKTGTLTRNRMAVAEVASPASAGAQGGGPGAPSQHILGIAARACPADTIDPMERALLDAARADPGGTRVHEYALGAELLATTHVWRVDDGGYLVATKGAPEAVASLCALAPERQAEVAAATTAMASRGLRVLGVASARWQGLAEALPLSPHGFRFEWHGLVGLADPLRDGVPAAVAEATAAGVRVVMLTGDHPQTARAIARQAGLARAERVLTGADLARLDDASLARAVADVDVFARVRPEDKLRLVGAFKHAGAVVAMTGDGVNDAPALVAAHVGIAMGSRGTDVAREAAAIVLLDDDFVTVIRAIREGRTIYDNLVRAVRYILAVHVPITGLALLPLLLGAPLVLLPLHVVFLELIIDPASTLVFEREPADAAVMRRPPRPPHKRLLDLPTLLGSLAEGGLVFAAVAATYLAGRANALSTGQLAAIAFTALVVGNVGLIVANRSPSPGRWRLRANPVFWIVVALALGALALATRVEVVGAWFGFAPAPGWPTLLALVLPLVLLAPSWRAVARRAVAWPG
jgi:Ca2+-transporting ATPase